MGIRFKPIAITTGDHQGIGAEVIAKGIHDLFRKKKKLQLHDVVILGSPDLYKPYQKFLPALSKQTLWKEKDVFEKDWQGPTEDKLNFILPESHHIPKAKKEAYLCGRYIELAAKGVLSEKFSALSTGPIDKNILQQGGYLFDGHTEMLQSLCKSKTVTMMLASPQMRVSLVTVHSAIKNVSKNLTQEKVKICLENTSNGLKRFFKIKKPRIAVLGLNPHAGDQGLFGDEEKTTIIPAISSYQKKDKDVRIEGPYAADGFFGKWNTHHHKNFDAVVCMYHDQGLIPIKLLDFKNTVNLSLGLPLLRTSVDHGVGYDIAGKGIADPSSFIAALSLAFEILKWRKKNAF